jgi:hypothetical protein
MQNSSLDGSIKSVCVFCRTPFPTTEAEGMKLVLKQAKKKKPWALRMMGQHYEGKDMDDLRDMMYIAAMNGGDLIAGYHLGGIMEKKGHLKLAKQYFLMSANGKLPMGLVQMGIIFLREEKLEKARAMLSQAAEQECNLRARDRAIEIISEVDKVEYQHTIRKMNDNAAENLDGGYRRTKRRRKRKKRTRTNKMNSSNYCCAGPGCPEWKHCINVLGDGNKWKPKSKKTLKIMKKCGKRYTSLGKKYKKCMRRERKKLRKKTRKKIERKDFKKTGFY